MNVLFFSIDNLRYDCSGFQPDKRELHNFDVLKHLATPTTNRIAEKSLCFTQCISTNTYTTASHASIFTGLYPPRHGVRGFYNTVMSAGVPTIAEVLGGNGYRTVMYTDSKELFVTGVRWDEQEARSSEEYFSKRGNPPHVRVQPILHFREIDIWQYIKRHGVPYCELYNRNYRSLGCMPCTSSSTGSGSERSGRARDKEEIMARLRELGYF